jgi:hypothetical protein
MRRPKQSNEVEAMCEVAPKVFGHYASAYVAPRKCFVHELWQQGLYLDGDSIAAGFGFDAVSAFHKGNYSAAIAAASDACSINEAWQALFELL